MHRGWALSVAALGGAVIMLFPAEARAADFTDTVGHFAETEIDEIAALGITAGCGGGAFCPDAPLRREEMAIFLDRALSLPPASNAPFVDIGSSFGRRAIESIYDAGITTGCDPTHFCPTSNVTRAEMAVLMVEAFNLPASSDDPVFTDTAGSFAASDAEALAASGVATGCGPGRFCPNGLLTRGEMAVMLVHALGYDGPSGGTQGIIAVVGCSVTRNGIEGYHAVGGTKFVDDYAMGGGSIGAWTNPSSSYWDDFDASIAGYDPSAVFLQLCTFGPSAEDYADAVQVIGLIRDRLPDATVYIAGQPTYEAGWVCNIAGADGPPAMAEVAARLVADGFGVAGPATGPLGDDTTEDGCHANDAGKELMGEQLYVFFG